jgi:putative hemolysin
MWLEIVLIFIFILVNGFFAASEIAVVTSRRTRIKQLIEEGNKNAKILNNFKDSPDRFLATIQIGVTMSGAIASAIGGAAAVEVIEPALQAVPISFIAASGEVIAIGIVVIAITYCALIFGELIPKSIALSNPEKIGLLTAGPVERFSKLATLFVRILTASTNILLKPFGRKAFSERGYITEEEVKMLIEEGGERGVFEPEEKELVHNIFEFTDIFVKEVMLPAPQMITIGINMTDDETKAIIAKEKFSRYPVIGNDINDIRGMLYVKDFYNILTKTGKAVIHKIVRPPMFVPETMKISILLREMQKKRMHMAIVIDEYGAVSGLVTLEDLLEEIVGEIRDEDDLEIPVIEIGDGSYIIDASISIRDLSEDYGIDIPESPEYETLSGFIVTYFQRIPKTGDTIDIDGKRLRVVEMVGQRIAKVKMERLESEQIKEDKIDAE